jgi:RimJ/RimL family protein N-acetyltransferase
MISIGLNAFITTQGFSKYSMINVVVGALTNIILDPIFIYGFSLGVKGAALATIISQGVSATLVIAFLLSKKSKLKITLENLKPDIKIILSCLALGLAPFIMQSTESILNICFNTSLYKYGGDIAVGAMTICTSLMMFAMMPLQGFTQGAQPIISYNFGAKNPSRIKKAFKILLITCFVYSLVYWSVVMLLPKTFAGIFTTEIELIEFASSALRIYMGCICLFGIQIACQQTFIALGNAPISLFLALLRKVFLLIPLIYVLPLFIENKTNAVFLAEPIADFIAVSTTLITFLIVFKKTMKKLNSTNHLGSKELITERLILRKLKKEDAKEIFEGFINQEKFLYYSNKEKRTLEEEIKSLEGIEDKYLNLTYYNWVICLKENGTIIGSINAHYIQEKDKVVINYAIDERYRNNNYMSETLIEVLKYLKEEVRISNIECGCVIENIASKRVMEKANMKYVGTLKKEVILKDGYHDMHLYRY